MLTLLIQTTGWLLAHTPECALRGATALLAEGLFLLRRRLILSNLHHAFPEKSAHARHSIARASCRRMIETVLLSLATPFIPLRRLRKIVTTTPAMNALVAAQQTRPRPHVLVTPHFAYWESVTCFPIAVPEWDESPPFFAAIYRPMNNPTLDAWLKTTRERHGITLLSRRKGFQDAIRILRGGGAVSVLYDQNAGDAGALTTLLGRVCSTTELPGILAQKFSAPIVSVYAQRRGFWRVAVHAEEVIPAHDATDAGAITRRLNRWLEDTLHRDTNARDSWLWAHARWKNQDHPDRRLRLQAKRNLLTEETIPPTDTPHARTTSPSPKWKRTPSSTRLWVRLPNWLGDVVMLIPLLRALRTSRPDAQLTLIGKAAFAPLIEDLALADRFIALPERRRKGSLLGEFRYFAAFWKLRRSYPDCLLLFTNSARGDIEAFLTRAPQRFGIVRPGKPRPLLTHSYVLPHDYDEARHHQLDLWADFLRRFGLEEAPLRTPLHPPKPTAQGIGLIAGSENAPEKRWPIAHWVALIDALPPELPIRLFGTAKDRTLTDQIAALARRPTDNLAGRTDLRAYCAALRDCAALVTNDTGGMHLANALGVPLIALFGPTNPVRTGPVFAAPVTILQPANCPPTGGAKDGTGDLAALSPETVLTALQPLLPTQRGGG